MFDLLNELGQWRTVVVDRGRPHDSQPGRPQFAELVNLVNGDCYRTVSERTVSDPAISEFLQTHKQQPACGEPTTLTHSELVLLI